MRYESETGVSQVPILGEMITLTNGRGVDKASLEALLRAGASFAVQVRHRASQVRHRFRSSQASQV